MSQPDERRPPLLRGKHPISLQHIQELHTVLMMQSRSVSEVVLHARRDFALEPMLAKRSISSPLPFCRTLRVLGTPGTTDIQDIVPAIKMSAIQYLQKPRDPQLLGTRLGLFKPHPTSTS